MKLFVKRKTTLLVRTHFLSSQIPVTFPPPTTTSTARLLLFILFLFFFKKAALFGRLFLMFLKSKHALSIDLLNLNYFLTSAWPSL